MGFSEESQEVRTAGKVVLGRSFSFAQEFLTFIKRGNVMDLAVGVIIGAAFGKIVSSLVADILMPPIGYMIGGVKFTDLHVVLGKNPDGKPVTINYGNFLQASFDFLIIAFCVFLLIKLINSLMRAPAPVPPAPSDEVKLLTEIRDLLKAPKV
jgi:large conductance mechanosensitive channel